MGFAPPMESDDAPLVHAADGYMMICLQIEEKILPPIVVRQQLAEQVKHIETQQQRKVRLKEKNQLKDDLYQTLLPRAFSKHTRIYAYIDTRRNWLLLNTCSAKAVDAFTSMFQKVLPEIGLKAHSVKKPGPIMTHWLLHDSCPAALTIEKKCVLQDPNNQSRVIRAQQQDLFANSILTLVKDGCHVKQLSLCWQDHIAFDLCDDFTLRTIRFKDDLIEAARELNPETRQQQFDGDFVIMTEALGKLVDDLLEEFGKVGEELEVA